MNQFKTIALMGALVAGLPATVGFAGLANAAEQFNVSDLQLSAPADAATFKSRGDAAASRVCMAQLGRTDLGAMNSCRAAVWEEIADQLTPAQRVAL